VALFRLTREGHGKFFHSVPSGSSSVMDATVSAMCLSNVAICGKIVKRHERKEARWNGALCFGN